MNPVSATRIEQLLDQQIGLARDLAASLETERDALTGTSAAPLTENTARKLHLLGQFEQLEHERRRLFEESGYSQPADEAHPAGTPLPVAQRWNSLLGLMGQCRKANETNGLILKLKQGQVHQLLGILRGAPSITYGPGGQTFAAAIRPLARA
jgi:flagellar biosynthesis/type III secretory pathway chaperone